jgi:hypothetical protein
VIGYRVAKSPFRQFLLGLAGILLILAAMDVVWLHKVSSEPLKDDAGQITTRGEAWRRTDLIWGTLFLVSGAGLFGAAAIGLASGMAIAEITYDGLRLRIGGPQQTVTLPWDDIISVRSVLVDGEGVHPRPVLVVEVEDPSRYRPDVWGGEWVGRELRVDADGWAEPPEELVVRMEIALDRFRREGAADGQVDVEAAGSPDAEPD